MAGTVTIDIDETLVEIDELQEEITVLVEGLPPRYSLEQQSGFMQLVNDAASPGNNMYYGTDGTGVRGWYSSSGGMKYSESIVFDGSAATITHNLGTKEVMVTVRNESTEQLLDQSQFDVTAPTTNTIQIDPTPASGTYTVTVFA